MPLTPPGIVGVLAPNLAATGNIGMGMPQLSSGVAAGIMLWNGVLKVTTVDTGTAGMGAGALPCLIPQPLLLSNLLTGFASFGNVGPMMPLLALGLSNGLALAFLQGIVTTVHPSVGTGTAVARFVGSSAVPLMIAGFASVGMVGPGPIRIASSIGMGLDLAFAVFSLLVPIIGPPSPIASSGVGTGQNV